MAAPTEETQPLIEAVAVAVVVAEELPQPGNFREIVKLFAAKREGLLEYHLASSVRLVRFEAGVIEINPMSSAPPNLANRVGTLLSGWTGRRWVVGISSAPGEPTLAEVDATNRAASFDAARNGPTVQALMEAFPGATITDVRELGPAPVQTDSPVDDDQMNDLGDIEIIETILEPGDDS